jgi:hypothetical protein
MVTEVGLILLGVIGCFAAWIVAELIADKLFLNLMSVLARIWRDFKEVLRLVHRRPR